MSTFQKHKICMTLFFLWFSPVIAVFVLANEPQPTSPDKSDFGIIDAIRIALEKNPSIIIQKKQVDIQAANLQIQKAIFDTSLTANASVSQTQTPLKLGAQTTDDHITSDSQTLSASAIKLLRNGIILTPSLQTTRLDSGITGDTIGTTSSVFFDLTYPLLNGKGEAVTASGELAAKLDLEGSRQTLNHTISVAVFNTASLYWRYLASYRALTIFRESEQRAQKLVDDVQTIINADEMPANEILQLKANLAQKRSNRIGAELSLKSDRENLGVALGMDPIDIRNLPLPSDAFPDLTLPNIDTLFDVERFIDHALQQRGDLQERILAGEAAQVVLNASRNRLKPNLDLIFSAGYKSLEEGSGIRDFWGGLYENIPGPSASISLRYQFPLKNNRAKGIFAQNHAIRDQIQISTADVERQISSDVFLALENVRHSYMSLEEAKLATSTYLLAVENEIKKLQLGFSTLLDVISSEDLLRNSQLNQINLERQLSIALLDIRFAIGSLVNLQTSQHTLTYETLTTFPKF